SLANHHLFYVPFLPSLFSSTSCSPGAGKSLAIVRSDSHVYRLTPVHQGPSKADAGPILNSSEAGPSGFVETVGSFVTCTTRPKALRLSVTRAQGSLPSPASSACPLDERPTRIPAFRVTTMLTTGT